MARKGGNPETYFKSGCQGQIAKKSIGVKLPVELDEFVRSLPNKSEWVREAIAEKYEREVAPNQI